MVDNFVAHLFSHIEVKKHNTLIDEIDYPGIASTVKGCVECPGLNVYNGKAINSGFKSHNYEVKQFEAVGNLGSFGLGFFNDITVPIYKGRFEIIFIRNNDNNVIYLRKSLKTDGTEDASTLPNEGKIVIKTFCLRVPIIEYNSDAEIMLIKELLDNSYFFQLKNWQCIQHMKVIGKTLHLDITNIYRNVTNPLWAFVVFQTSRSGNQQKDNSEFDHTDVKNLWMEVGGTRYPEEFWDLDFDENLYALAYEAFQDFKTTFFKTDSIPYVDKKGFKAMYPIYSIDLTGQPQNVSNVKSNMLHVDFNKALPDPSGSNEGNICYIVRVSNCLLRYEPDKNKIT